MLGLFPPPARIYLYAKNVDMRKSFDGLLGIIQAEFQKDVRHGDLFLFLNRRLDRIKLMGWDRDGLLIVYKRLEVGTFQRPVAKPGAPHVELDATEVAILLTGIDLASVKRRRRYALPPVSAMSEPSTIESRS